MQLINSLQLKRLHMSCLMSNAFILYILHTVCVLSESAQFLPAYHHSHQSPTNSSKINTTGNRFPITRTITALELDFIRKMNHVVSSGRLKTTSGISNSCELSWTILKSNYTPVSINLSGSIKRRTGFQSSRSTSDRSLNSLFLLIESNECPLLCITKSMLQKILLQSGSGDLVTDFAHDSFCCHNLIPGRGCLWSGSGLSGRQAEVEFATSVWSTKSLVDTGFTLKNGLENKRTNSSPLNLKDVPLRRTKRVAPGQLAEAYSSIDHRLLPPRNLQIVPLRFGTFNISWVPAAKNEPWISHFELVLLSLGDLPTKEESDGRCLAYRQQYNLTDADESTYEHTLNQGQLTVNVSAPASWTVVTGLPADNFYRVLLFAMAGTQRSPPASMPSSPRVPALPPKTAPQEIKVTPRGIQSAKISWEPPEGADCTGELISYVITINSSRLLEPIVIKVPREKRSYVVEDLVPGTHYTVQIAATTRGGMGIASNPLQFRTGGEMPRVDLDDAEDIEEPLTTDLPEEIGNEFYEGTEFKEDWTVDLDGQNLKDPRLFMVPAKIHGLRATASQTSIRLKWTVALRRINPETEGDLITGLQGQVGRIPDAPAQPMQISLSTSKNGKSTPSYLPSGTKYLIRWGDVHPGPSEDSVRGDETEYVIENLRPGTIYYIRVIAITPLGEGPAAYTVTRTRHTMADEHTSTSIGPLIPVNLVVQAVGSTWARVGWELSHLPSTEVMPSMAFQIKYYAINADNLAEPDNPHRSSGRGLSAYERDVELVNLTLPNQNRGFKRANHFKAMLRGLRPGTQYEFGVCLLQPKGQNQQTQTTSSTSNYCWSMVQGFETFGQNPKDPPQKVRILVPDAGLKTDNIGTLHFDFADTSIQPTVSESAYPVRLSWDPPMQPNGRIVAYTLYLTANRQQSSTSWIERAVHGSVTAVDLKGLGENRIYYMRLAARNGHGRSPLTPVIVFRTPDEKGNGCGIYKLSREYYDARDIDEPLETVITGSVEATDSEAKLKGENLRWVVVGSLLGGALVITVVITLVLLNRCRKGRNSLGLMKGQPTKQPYVPAYPNFYHSDPSRPAELVQKIQNFNIPDTCIGSCSLSGSATGGSQSGPVGTLAQEHACGAAFDALHKHDHSSHMNSPNQTLSCPCSEWSSKGLHNQNNVCTTESKCACYTSTDGNVPPHWITIGHSCNINMGGCLDDRHSTPVGSEKDASACGSAGMRRLDPGLGRKLSARGIMDTHECYNHECQRTENCGSAGGFHKQENWSRLTNEHLHNLIAPPREMTISYLSSNQHNHMDCHGNQLHPDKCDLHDNLQQQTPQQQQKMALLKPHLGNGYNSIQGLQISAGERSPEFIYIQTSRHGTGMLSNHGFNGSGSLHDDEVLTSSPASSSAGVTCTGLTHLSTSPSNGHAHFVKLQQNPLQGFVKSDMEKHLGNRSPQRIGMHQNAVQSIFDNRGKISKMTEYKIGRQVQSNVTSRVMNENSPIVQQKNKTGNVGNPTRINVMSSDYASQQSSLSNPSSASSNAGLGYSPERPASNRSPPIDADHPNMSNIGLSFTLDRVPTPEPTPRPAPFSRLAAGDLLNHQLKLRAPVSCREDVLIKNDVTDKLLSTPLLKNKANDLIAVPPGFERESPPDTPDSLSQKEMMRGYSAEELNQEMANLEGLMKDLNQITQNQFDC